MVEMDNKVIFLKLRKIHRRPPGANAVAPQGRPVRALAGRSAEDLGVGEQGKFRRRTDEPPRGGKRQKFQPGGIEIKIRRQFLEPLVLALVVTGECDLPSLRGPISELVEEPAALDLIEDQVAGSEFRKWHRVERDGQVVIRQGSRTKKCALGFFRWIDLENRILAIPEIQQRRLFGSTLRHQNLDILDLTD